MAHEAISPPTSPGSRLPDSSRLVPLLQLRQATSRRFSLPPPDSLALLATGGLYGAGVHGESGIRRVVYIPYAIRFGLSSLGFHLPTVASTGVAVQGERDPAWRCGGAGLVRRRGSSAVMWRCGRGRRRGACSSPPLRCSSLRHSRRVGGGVVVVLLLLLRHRCWCCTVDGIPPVWISRCHRCCLCLCPPR